MTSKDACNIHEKLSYQFLVFQNAVVGNGSINFYGDREHVCTLYMYMYIEGLCSRPWVRASVG
jgi:hypothetical protein